MHYVDRHSLLLRPAREAWAVLDVLAGNARSTFPALEEFSVRPKTAVVT